MTQVLQLLRKIFNQCNRQRLQCQMKSWKKQLSEAVTIVVSRHPDEMADLRPGWSEAHRVEGPTKINCCRFVSLYALKSPALTGAFLLQSSD